ncbi:MAG: SRPBCC family protein [Desulfobacula sp.]|nr:SRPBCC family protein [Desulfobacula sp.]
MGEQHIEIIQLFNAPVDTIFNILTDHQAFGQLINAKIKRIVDSPGDNKNGLGAVRRVKAFPAPAFEETVIAFKPNLLLEYEVSKGSPIKDHKGRMEFFDEQGKTRVHYTIDFKPKLPFIFLGFVLKKVLEKSLGDGLKKLAGRYSAG